MPHNWKQVDNLLAGCRLRAHHAQLLPRNSDEFLGHGVSDFTGIFNQLPISAPTKKVPDSLPGRYLLSLIIAIRAQERAYRNNFIGKIGSTFIFPDIPRYCPYLPQKTFFRFLYNMLDILSRITDILDTWDISPQVFKPKPKETETMDTRTETETLALSYAKGIINTFELNCSLGTPFGICEHEEHEHHADAYDYLEEVLDIRYVVDSNRQYIGAQLLLACGGPNVWLDTVTQKLSVYWDSNESLYVPQSITRELDEALAELWEMGN